MLTACELCGQRLGDKVDGIAYYSCAFALVDQVHTDPERYSGWHRKRGAVSGNVISEALARLLRDQRSLQIYPVDHPPYRKLFVATPTQGDVESALDKPKRELAAHFRAINAKIRECHFSARRVDIDIASPNAGKQRLLAQFVRVDPGAGIAYGRGLPQWSAGVMIVAACDACNA